MPAPPSDESNPGVPDLPTPSLSPGVVAVEGLRERGSAEEDASLAVVVMLADDGDEDGVYIAEPSAARPRDF